jgi:hypothetical protein
MYPSVIPPYNPPRKRSPVGWILAFIGMGLFVLVVVAVMMMARFGRRFNDQGGTGSPPAARQGERAIDESTADKVVTFGSDTTFTKTFPLAEDAKLFLKNVNGNITVTAWDEPKAEVNVIKKDRNAQVFFTNNGANLSIRTASTRGNQDVRFELKVPRELAHLELNSTNGIIKVSEVKAEIVVEATNGAIDLTDVAGVSRVHTVNGSIRATVLEAGERGMEFESTNGAIDLTVPTGFEANLDASTVHGTINVDDSLGVEVVKGVVGQKAKGQIGIGGERLRLSTVNGSIKLTTAEQRATTRATKKGKENGN